jgi:intracellular sulfur oxidation DsrE/DsrF family protein
MPSSRRTALAALVFAFAALSSHVHAQAPAAQKNRLVVQVSDNDTAKWNLALNNIRNVQQDLGAANVEIELVAYGPGIGMLKMESPVANRVAEALKWGVQVVACENTMQNQKLKRDDMLSSIGYVKAGVVELMQKQQQGWAYLRP